MQPGREVKLNFKKVSEMITGPGGGSKSGTRQSKFRRRRHQRAPPSRRRSDLKIDLVPGDGVAG